MNPDVLAMHSDPTNLISMYYQYGSIGSFEQINDLPKLTEDQRNVVIRLLKRKIDEIDGWTGDGCDSCGWFSYRDDCPNCASKSSELNDLMRSIRIFINMIQCSETSRY